MRNQFCTIREFHERHGLSIYNLRLMKAAGQLPGFYSGTRFYINEARLLEQLTGTPGGSVS